MRLSAQFSERERHALCCEKKKSRTRECNEYVIHVQSEQRAKTNWMNIGSLVARPACRQNRIYVLMGSDSRFERAHIEAIDACVIFRAPFAAQQTPICNKFLYSLCCRCRLFIRFLSLSCFVFFLPEQSTWVERNFSFFGNKLLLLPNLEKRIRTFFPWICMSNTCWINQR